jgi:hypothetical protein
MLKLKNSGYSRKYRREILDSATKAFNKMLEDDKNNIKPLFRARSWNKLKEMRRKRIKGLIGIKVQKKRISNTKVSCLFRQLQVEC